jgi:hypothetical protein
LSTFGKTKFTARNQVISKAYVKILQQAVAVSEKFIAIPKNPRIVPSQLPVL